MANVLSLRDAPRDESGRLALVEKGGNEKIHVLHGNVSTREIPSFAVDIRREIYIAVMSAGGAVTRAQIARAVGRKKSRWLNECIEQLVTDGYLYRSQGYWKNGVVMYWYEVNQ